MRCIIDYETRSELDLTKTGAIEYAKHPSTSILCMGYKIDDRPAKLWIPERALVPDALWNAFNNVSTLVAHNAGFERAITRYTLTRYDTLTYQQKKIAKMKCAPNWWVCTAAKAAAASLPRSLGDVCDALDLPIKKDMEGNRLMKKYMKPRKPSKNNPKLWWDDKDELRRIYRYCLTDLNAEYELDKALPDLSPEEQEVWELDQKINDRGVLIDVPTVNTILKMIGEEKTHINKRVSTLTHGEIQTPNQTIKLLAWLKKQEHHLPNLQAQTVRDYLENHQYKNYVQEVLELRQAASKSSTAKYKTMLKAVGEDHIARELLLYCGADRTGRWSGKRIQPQNFPRPTPELQKMGFNSDEAIELIGEGNIERIREKYGPKVMDVFASVIRGMIIAPEGEEFFDADWAAIEARIAFWMSGDEGGIKAFKENRKIYEEMAIEIFGMSLDEVTKESLERFVAKESILGCQYGMGDIKFLNQCHKKGMKQVTKEIARKAVRAYRKKYSAIPEAWHNLEYAFIQAIKHPDKIYKTTMVKIFMRGDFLIMKLPSGRPIKYYKPRVVNVQKFNQMKPEIRYMGKGWIINPETGKPKKAWCEKDAWGGDIFNHAVQGTARDFMVHGIKRIENAGYKFCLSVHDEGLSSRKKGEGSLKEYIHLLAGELPEWGKDCPLKAEGWVGPRYRK